MKTTSAIDLDGLTVLIVEDVVINCLIIERWLTRVGMTVQCTDSVLGANQFLETQHFDVVLLDRFLPDGEGFALLTQLRQRPRTRVIAMTALQDNAEYMQIQALGFDAVLRKPIQEQNLLNALHMAQEPVAEAAPLDASAHDEEQEGHIWGHLRQLWQQGEQDQLMAALAARLAMGRMEDPVQRRLYALNLALTTRAPCAPHIEALLGLRLSPQSS